MPAPQITALPDPPSRQDPTNFAVKGDAFLGALPDFATEANALATQVNERVDDAFAAGLESAATNAATTVTKAAEARASELAAAGFANEAMLLSLGVETLRPSIKPSLLLDFARAQVVPPSVAFTRVSTATRVGPSGLIETVGINVPRLEYDPITRACLGFWVEEQRTNLLTNSLDANGVSAAGGSVPTITNVSGVAPDGVTRNLKQVVFQPGDSRVRVSIPGTAANPHYVSVFYFNTTTNKWTRVGAVNSSSGGATVLADFTQSSFNNQGTVFLSFTQIEAGSFPTTYIPTTTVSVTRAPDLATLPSIAPWFRTDEGTLFVEASTFRTLGSGFSFQIDSGADTNRLVLNTSGNRGDSLIDGVNVAPLIGATQPANTNIKAAYAYRLNDYGYSFNGAPAITDTSAAVPQNLTTARVGSRVGGGEPLSGLIRQIKYFPQRLTNAQLQALTSL